MSIRYEISWRVRWVWNWFTESLAYSRFLWSNHPNWDWAYTLSLFQFKLKRMAKCIKSNGIVMESDQIHDEIMQVVKLIDRILDSSDYIDDELGELLLKRFDRRRDEDGLLRSWPNQLTPEEEDRLTQLMEESENRREADWSLLFQLLEKNMRNWWE